MIISLGPKKVEIQTFQIKNTFTVTKDFRFFSLVLSNVTNLRERFVRVLQLFKKSLWNLYEFILAPKKLLKTQIFEKKSYFFSEKNIVASFFSYYRV